MDETPPEMKPRKTGLNFLGSLLLWCLVGMVCYVLSAAPVAVLYQRTAGPHSQALEDALETIYAPAFWLHTTCLRAPLDRWFVFWKNAFKSKSDPPGEDCP